MSSTELPSVATANALPKVLPVRVAEGERLRSVRLPGVTLTLRSRPPARKGLPPALYVHGLGGSSQNWSELMERLDGTVDSEALDLPGFGDSPPPDDGDFSVTGHARAVIRYLDAAERGPVHLLGNSLGGAVTTRVAAVRPDLVRSLTLISPALPELRIQRSALPTALLAMPGMIRLLTRFSQGWTAEQRVRGVLALCYGDPGQVTTEGFEHAVEEMERRLQLPYFWDAMARSARGIVDAYTLGGQHGLWRQAERVLAPTLLVYGGRDQLVGFRMAQKAARSFRDNRLLSLPDAGHVAMMEYPGTVATAFRELLRDVDAASGTDAEPAAARGAVVRAVEDGGSGGSGVTVGGFGGSGARGPGSSGASAASGRSGDSAGSAGSGRGRSGGNRAAGDSGASAGGGGASNGLRGNAPAGGDGGRSGSGSSSGGGGGGGSVGRGGDEGQARGSQTRRGEGQTAGRGRPNNGLGENSAGRGQAQSGIGHTESGRGQAQAGRGQAQTGHGQGQSGPGGADSTTTGS